MASIFIFLIALFSALWIFTSNTNKKKKPGNSSEIAEAPTVTDNSFTPFPDVVPSDFETNGASANHRHDYHDYHHHDYGGDYD